VITSTTPQRFRAWPKAKVVRWSNEGPQGGADIQQKPTALLPADVIRCLVIQILVDPILTITCVACPLPWISRTTTTTLAELASSAESFFERKLQLRILVTTRYDALAG